jgi:hypothetical protein
LHLAFGIINFIAEYIIATMKKQITFLLLLFALCNTSCTKNNDNNQNKPSDIVIGNYNASASPGWVSGTAIITKTSNNNYQFTPGTAAVPSFFFQYDALGSFFSNEYYYTIPKQASGAAMLDSARLTLDPNSGGRPQVFIYFTLTDRSNNVSWKYGATKQ